MIFNMNWLIREDKVDLTIDIPSEAKKAGGYRKLWEKYRSNNKWANDWTWKNFFDFQTGLIDELVRAKDKK